jgi:outer membrane protein OmpA-like peptidoglycan-associated protein
MKKILVAAVVLVLAGCAAQQTSAPPPPSPAAPTEPPRAKAPMPPIRSAGPLTQAGVDVYMDGQEADLRQYMRGQGVLVARRGNDIALIVLTDRLFDRSAISNWGDAFARALVQVIGHYDHTAIDILCYTDASGSEADNLAVSQKRAKSLADALSGYGITAGRLAPKGLGAANPRTTNPADAKNRRIEIKISPRPS